MGVVNNAILTKENQLVLVDGCKIDMCQHQLVDTQLVVDLKVNIQIKLVPLFLFVCVSLQIMQGNLLKTTRRISYRYYIDVTILNKREECNERAVM